METNMKNSIARIIIFSMILCALLGILVIGIRTDLVSVLTHHHAYVNDRENSSETFSPSPMVNSAEEASASLSPDEISKLSIDWPSGKITVEAGDVGAITYQETGADDDRPMVATHSGDELRIRYAKNTYSIGLFHHKDLTVVVPRDWMCSRLRISTASAEIAVTGLSVDVLEVDAASGKCTIRDCYAGEVDVDTASGDVFYSGTLNSFDCDCASAAVTLELCNVPNEISMDSASGSMDITLPDDAGFQAEIDGLSRSFSSDFETSSHDGVHRCGDGACEIDMDTASGKLTIHKGNCSSDDSHHIETHHSKTHYAKAR